MKPRSANSGPANSRRSQAGFSLVEMLVVVAILTIVLGTVFRQLINVQTRSRSEEVKIDMVQQARESMDQMVRDIHLVGYPNKRMYTSGVVTTPINNSTKLAVGLVKITSGTSSEIRFEGDVDNDGSIDSVIYRLVSTSTESNQCPCIERSQVTKAAADPLTGQGTAYHVAVENVAASGLAFTAYDSNGANVSIGTGLDINSNATTLASIKTIRIAITLQGRSPDQQTRQFPTISMESLVKLLNN
jgi:prepilin-type N-terminal cleavage/methylation domain-containing protein